MNPDEMRERLKAALWLALEESGIADSDLDRMAGKRLGWLHDQKRRCTRLDVGDFVTLLNAAGIEASQFFASLEGREKRAKENPAPEPPFKEGSILDLAQKNWDANEE